ncbi:MAG: antitoxin [Deltaproteobacteria bacterium RIFOXYA12_FULL_58_15]|nr:MAG: antitoxin [Deltaproteobacteria bacterium RIFOXYA12_FULL_58_15]OGR10950.1 MAG: antitoxin [Deltaproteobacteria bacterium RIFOXYB12_FULL_58_9]
MALSIKSPEADRLARELSQHTGETLTEAIVVALRERVARYRHRKMSSCRREKLRALRQSMKNLPILDHRGAEEVIGYDELGLPS